MADFQLIDKYLKSAVGWLVFAAALTVYLLTVPPEVSYWDCPEYVSSAYLLEIGHPPGNPAWTLFHRVVTMIAPAPQFAALAVNIASACFMAAASSLIALILYPLLRRLSRKLPALLSPSCSAVGALTAALCFAFCDSAWYSAVEAEVYAMSTFFTALTVWLAVRTTPIYHKPLPTDRTLILIAYLTGLSLGIHELNLLVIPALAVIFTFGANPRKCFGKAAAAFCAGLATVGVILCGMMVSTVSLAGETELFAVNTLHLPYNSGVIIYGILLLLSAVTAIAVCRRTVRRVFIFLALIPLLFLSGIFIFSDCFIAGAVISVSVAAALAYFCRSFRIRRRLLTMVWMIVMTLTGYSVYTVILLRGDVDSQANSVFPGNPFSLRSYIARDQYGSHPLIYGKTSYSRKMMTEGSNGSASHVALSEEGKIWRQWRDGAEIHDTYGFMTDSDSAVNDAVARQRHGYLVAGYRAKAIYTPELDMWFPRIHGSRKSDLNTYREWIGMTPETMDSVETSVAFDADGNAVGRRGEDGNRHPDLSFRPTALQNIEWFLSYQSYYMYLRYLLWNFAGRQNDVPSSGEADHGNFITGFDAVDALMLGEKNIYADDVPLPNKGRNVYWLIPLALGLTGIIALARGNRLARRSDFIIFLLFLMTGFAIVVYLNQTPNEPRERDYSFLGSYMAFAAWIGCGATWIIASLLSRLSRCGKRRGLMLNILRVVLLISPMAVPAMMLAVNYDDHDRSGRRAAGNIAVNLLESLDRDAIIFVEGDNRTFPLWYAQEVLGVRRDVRVVNLSYLSIPEYAGALRRQWRDSAPLPSAGASAADFGAFMLVSLPDSVADRRMDAFEALRRLFAGDSEALPAGLLSIPLDGDTAVVNMRTVIHNNGFKTLPFRRLATLDIIAANAASPEPRPVYWLRNASLPSYAGLQDHVSRQLIADRLGNVTPDPGILISGAKRLRKPNGDATDVYVDEAPMRQIADQHASLIEAASLLADRNELRAATILLGTADSIFGQPERGVMIFDRRGSRLLSDTTSSLRNRLNKHTRK